ncbi:MAG TPA: SRPBCC family protein [Actinopolymorphaceae bacterium]|mgnify:CR=1 FL=1|jgi:uncharacterized protein YndB with AHSA1/START domain
MIEVTRKVSASPKQIFEVLSDGWSYASWVLGTSHIRAVDPEWPRVGSKIHHMVGPWPFVIKDETEVIGMEPDSRLELHARAWPVGAAHIHITLVPKTSTETEVRLAEELVDAPGRMIPHQVQELMFRPRNTETLSRLADLAEGRSRRA